MLKGDVMGPALGGLDQLLKLPTGCGEQNMVLFAPNIYVLEYLTNTDQLTSSVRDKAIGFLHTGIFMLLYTPSLLFISLLIWGLQTSIF